MATKLTNKKRATDRTAGKVSVNMTELDMNYALLQSGGMSINRGIIILINRMRRLESIGLISLCDLFEPDEWKFMENCIRYKEVSVEQYLDKEVFYKTLQDSEVVDTMLSIYKIDFTLLRKKIELLSPLQTMALNCRIRDFIAKFPTGTEVPAAVIDRWSSLKD